MSNETRGVFLSLIMACSYSILTAAMKLFLTGAPLRSPTSVVLIRYSVSCLVMLVYAAWKRLIALPRHAWKELGLRGLLAGCSSLGFAFSLVYLDVGVATVVNYLSSIIAGPAGMFIGEKWQVRG